MSDWVEVRLTEIEMLHAALVGTWRHNYAVTHKYEDRAGAVADPATQLARNINGAAGEAAVAKLFDRYWGGHVDRFKGPDLGKAVQVRTRPSHDQDLIVQPVDDDSHAFVLVTGLAPHFRVWGWIMGRDAKQERWLEANGGFKPAYFVKPKFLHPICKLKKDDATPEEAIPF